MNRKMQGNQVPMDISDEDVLEAMKSINGYLDITPGDFKEIYIFAFKLALERLHRSVKAKDIMTTKIISVKKDTSLLKAAELMALYNISGLPVVDLSEHVVGIISEKDYLYEMGEKEKQTFMGVVVQCLKNKGCTAISLRNRTVKDIMSSPPITVFENTTVSDIATLFDEKKINRVPVINTDSKIVGIIARSDIVQSYCIISS